MTEDIKNEALEQLELDVKFGFENENEIFESISDMFYDVDEFDDDWLRRAISERYKQHQKDSLTWKRPTDFDRLVITFDQLIKEKIVCLHKAGYTKQDGESDCMETVEKLNELGIEPIGYCYYHSQDLARTVDKNIRNLYLGFDSSTQNDTQAIDVANKIVAKLTQNAFDVNWSGTIDQRIEIKNLNWQKIPDNVDWGQDRVVNIMTKINNDKKPFWKFW